MRATHISGAAFFKHKYLINPAVAPEHRVIKAAGTLAQALDNQMPPHMRKSTIQALSNLQDVFQQAAINYNLDPATHVTPAAPPRVPPNALPETASPATSPRVGTIAPSSQPSPLLSNHRTVNNPRVHDIPKTPVVPTRLDFKDNSLSPQRVLSWQSPEPNHQKSKPHPCHSNTDHSALPDFV